MSILEYLKERWITYAFIIFAFLFAVIVYNMDGNFNIRPSNARYIMAAWGLTFAAYAVIDYIILNNRTKMFEENCILNNFTENLDECPYPIDKKHAELVRNIKLENEKIKAELSTKSAEEMDFITKWLHDVKVPISAAKLILENYESELPGKFYRDIYTEIFSVEESTQRVFYEMKTNRFYDDYRIAKVSTRKLIANALKSYSNFFSYKKIRISIEGDDRDVLTDEKWSVYILSQIISNAVKYSPYEGAININVIEDKEKTTISVRNEGKGILESDLGQVFKKGYTASDNRAGVKATGYGLYLSKKLSDLLGHKLAADSKYNEYAVFSLTFADSDTIRNVTKM